MIGNWVHLSKQSQYPMQVISIGKDYCYLDFDGNEGDVFDGISKEMMPIEITKDFLLNNGFVAFIYEESYFMKLKNYYIQITKCNNSENKGWYCHIDNKRHDSIGAFNFQYLHELQNGIRLITGRDLTIKKI